jgi:hypothetical protein
VNLLFNNKYHMKRIFTLLLVVLSLTGCATVKGLVPSFWDDNQSRSIIDVRLAVDRLDCEQPHLAQVLKIHNDIRWFELYSESKGWRQADVLRLTAPLKESTQDFVRRSEDKQGSQAYCEIKKKLLAKQAATAAEAVLGRF